MTLIQDKSTFENGDTRVSGLRQDASDYLIKGK